MNLRLPRRDRDRAVAGAAASAATAPATAALEEFGRTNHLEIGEGGIVNRNLSLIVVLAAVAGLVGATAPARATYPGTTNGRLAFAMATDPQHLAAADIYTVMPNGEELQQLTDTPDFEACTAYSPDGKQ